MGTVIQGGWYPQWWLDLLKGWRFTGKRILFPNSLLTRNANKFSDVSNSNQTLSKNNWLLKKMTDLESYRKCSLFQRWGVLHPLAAATHRTPGDSLEALLSPGYSEPTWPALNRSIHPSIVKPRCHSRACCVVFLKKGGRLSTGATKTLNKLRTQDEPPRDEFLSKFPAFHHPPSNPLLQPPPPSTSPSSRLRCGVVCPLVVCRELTEKWLPGA